MFFLNGWFGSYAAFILRRKAIGFGTVIQIVNIPDKIITKYICY